MNGPTKYCVDNCTAVSLVESDRTLSDVLPGAENISAFMSVVAKIEFLSKPHMSAEEEQKRLNFLKTVKIIPLSPAVESATISLRREKHLKLPDAVIAATAALLKAPLLTADDHFASLVWPNFSIKLIL